ncbi:MAG: hypothetical protein ACK559_09660 [bacterium]
MHPPAASGTRTRGAGRTPGPGGEHAQGLECDGARVYGGCSGRARGSDGGRMPGA